MGRRRVIALMFSYSLKYCRDVLRGIRQYAAARPEWMLARVVPENRGLKMLPIIAPAGVIAQVFNARLARRLGRLSCPVVDVADILPDLRMPRVGPDDVAVGRLAAEHFWDRGLRRFGFVGHPNDAYSVGRQAGFEEAIRRLGGQLNVYCRPDTRLEPSGELWALDQSFHQWLLSLPKPVGILTCNDQWGAQACEVCLQVGLRVPDEVSIIGVDNDDLLCNLARPPLSSVDIPARRIGFEAAALLDRLLRGCRPPRRPLLLPPAGIATRQSSDLVALEDPEVAAAIRHIRDNAHRALQVPDVLEAVPVSRRSLERRFRSALGRSIRDEIRATQVERAKSLLAGTDLSMRQVALQSGFSGGTHLSVAFRRHTGITPTAYRGQFLRTGN